MSVAAELLAQGLRAGNGRLARAWAVTRRDGVTLGFTDHDRPVSFEGISFAPESGLSARALQSGTGLAVDNSEVFGALSAAAIRDEDLEAGRYDGAGLRLWWFDWADPAARALRFHGTLGEIRRGDGVFQAELRGLTEQLNQPRGRLFQRDCPAVLGDAACRFDLTRPGYCAEVVMPEGGVGGSGVHVFAGLAGFDPGWFAQGSLRVLGGPAQGLAAPIRSDSLTPSGLREIGLWWPLPLNPDPGDAVLLVPGCDRRAETCRYKFDNLVNFQGFPQIPGEEWLIAGPQAAMQGPG